MSGISPETIKAAVARLAKSDVIANVRRNEQRWRTWFPSEDSHVELTRADVLALISIAETYLKIHAAPTIFAMNVLGCEAEERLPAGWSIEVNLTPHETSLVLVDCDGEYVEVFPEDQCHFTAAIETAIATAAERAAEGGAD